MGEPTRMEAGFTIAVVVLILFAVVWALFELSPFARHSERFRDADGKPVGSSPRLD